MPSEDVDRFRPNVPPDAGRSRRQLGKADFRRVRADDPEHALALGEAWGKGGRVGGQGCLHAATERRSKSSRGSGLRPAAGERPKT